MQLPPLQVSLVVHALLSVQTAALFVVTHPAVSSQESVVHTFPSSHFRVAPPTQLPPLQVSLVVHALLSVQAAVLFVVTHPTVSSQASVVHTFPSSQLRAALPTQSPPLHVSLVVQALPSLQTAVLYACTQL
jgi:hypothetical protein